MNDLLKACEIALKYFKNNYGDIWIIDTILELEDKWIFFQGNSENPNTVYYGPQPVAINKNSFKAFHYVITEHLDELENSVEIEIPNKYKIAP